ncbi:hypothetical protein Y032_0113g355 [Ancylostoma ceylanicum]|uniref:Tetratricopeptide repeat protein n=1 Tax=Ancylostoma ceylanicum TaxID=53326 RepID=A0A016TDD5_9BILA|nr:hypothetical protein Y032_0113g355 [Ancylostoma ceylanicum]
MTEDLETIILNAGSAYSEGRYTEALESYEQAIAARPDNAILFANYAAILLRLGRVEEALKNADHAITLDPKWAKAYYRRGEALRRQNALLPAVVALSEGVALDPSNKLIADMLVDVAQQLFKNFPLERLQNVGLDRDRFTVLTMVGQELAAAGHHKDALTVLSRALTLHTPSLRLRESALSSLASVHFLLGEYTQAAMRYEQQLDIRLRLGGPPAEVHDNVAMSAEAAGNHTMALSHRRKKTKYLHGLLLAEERLKIARLLGCLNQGEEALEEYDLVEQSLPVFDETARARLAAQIRIGRGILYGSMGEMTKCLNELSEVTATSEDDAIAIADSIVACHIKEGNIQSAVEYLNNLLKSASDGKQQKLFGHACFLLAREQIRNGRRTSAVRLAKRILRLARATADRCLERAGLQLMATIYEEQQDAQSASALLRKYLEVPGAAVLESVNAQLHLAVLAKQTSDDPVKYLGDAMELAKASRNLDTIALTQSAMLRHLVGSASDDEQCRLLLSSQKELLKADISVASRSIIYEDLAMCEEGETSGVNELRALEQSLTEAQEGNHIRRELFLLEKLADSFMMLGKRAEAEGFYQQLLTLARQLRAVAQIKRGYMKLATLAGECLQWKRCLELTRNALTLSRLCHDHASKAHMLLLTGKAELYRGNSDVALSIFDKALSECEQHELYTTMAVASRFMVDAALKSAKNDQLVLDYLRRHISLFLYETDQKAKLRTLIRLARFDQDLDHITSLGVITAAKKVTSGMSRHDRATMLLECVDACQALGMRDETWRLLGDLLTVSNLSEAHFEEVANRLELFPLHRRALPLLQLVEQGFSHPRFLAQLAAFTPTFVLDRLSIEEILPRLVCYVKQGDWNAVLECATAALRDDAAVRSSVLDGVFGQISTEEVIQQVYLIAKWNVDGSIHWPTFALLNGTAFCSFFDLNVAQLLRHCVTLVPRSRAHLHALMFIGKYDVMHEAAQPVEKIICAANTGETEMLAMWYDELVHEYLNEQHVGIELFPFSSLEFQLKLSTVFVALQYEALEDQLRIMENCKRLIDARTAESRGFLMQHHQVPFSLHGKSFTYVFRVGRVELVWSSSMEADGFVARVYGGDLSFFEECLLRLLDLRGVPRASALNERTELLITNDHVQSSANPKLYSLHDMWNFTEQRHQKRGVLMLSNHSRRSNMGNGSIAERLRGLRDAFIAVVDVADHLLHDALCFSMGETPPIVITRGTLPFDLIRSLFLCGTAACIEVDENASDAKVQALITEIGQAEDVGDVLASYNCIVRSADCLHQELAAPRMDQKGLDFMDTRTRTDNGRIGAESTRTDELDGKETPSFVLETRHISNLWLNKTRLRVIEDTGGTAFAETIESLLRALFKDTSFPTRQVHQSAREEIELCSKRRRKKKAKNRVLRDYQSDGEGYAQPTHSRTLSDLPSRPTSSNAFNAD